MRIIPRHTNLVLLRFLSDTSYFPNDFLMAFFLGAAAFFLGAALGFSSTYMVSCSNCHGSLPPRENGLFTFRLVVRRDDDCLVEMTVKALQAADTIKTRRREKACLFIVFAFSCETGNRICDTDSEFSTPGSISLSLESLERVRSV